MKSNCKPRKIFRITCLQNFCSMQTKKTKSIWS